MITGEAVTRKDGRLKVTGAATYAAEFQVPGLVHAVLVQSTIAAGRIAGLDLQAAQGMPGVLAIITPGNASRLRVQEAPPMSVVTPTLQDGEVAYNGQHVAVVVADTLERALAAAARVQVRYQPGEAATRMEPLLSQAYAPKDFRGGARSPDSRRGDPEAALATAAVRVEATYTTPFEHHNPMEPHATTARWQDGRLEVWTATQGIGATQGTLAGVFGLTAEQVVVHSPYVGGGFGSKGNTWPPAMLAAMASRMVGRPVKLVLTRAQMYTSNGYRPQTIQALKLGARPDGTLVALRHDGTSSMSQPHLGEFTEPVGLASEMSYAVPSAAVSHRLVALNMGLPTYMRAPGEAPGMFALESAMDELAVALRMDPIDLRLRNYAETDPHEGKPFSSKNLRQCYAEGAAAFGWSRRTPEPRSMRSGRALVGLGMSGSVYPTIRAAASARVRLAADGTAVVQAGSQDLGTGTYTVMAQLAADELGLPVSRVRVELGDSRFPPAPVSGGSRTVASLGPAVVAACADLRGKLLSLAASDGRLGAKSAIGLRLEDGTVTGPGGRVPMVQVIAQAGLPSLEGMAEARPGREAQDHSMHAFGAQFCEVHVDPDLGTIRVARWVGVFDGGRVLNARTARSQLIGGITYGIGMALLEQSHVDADTGRFTNANVSEYLMPVNADVPDIQTILVPGDDRIANPVGAKGLGELPMVGAAAAVANAVHHATGVRVRDLPIRIEDVLA